VTDEPTAFDEARAEQHKLAGENAAIEAPRALAEEIAAVEATRRAQDLRPRGDGS
jgi:hypothetical protein